MYLGAKTLHELQRDSMLRIRGGNGNQKQRCGTRAGRREASTGCGWQVAGHEQGGARQAGDSCGWQVVGQRNHLTVIKCDVLPSRYSPNTRSRPLMKVPCSCSAAM